MTEMPSMTKASIRLPGMDATALCLRVAEVWCGSFSVRSARAIERLALRLAPEAAPLAATADIETVIHRRAREIVTRWFASLGLPTEGRAFDRLRHAFILANREGDLEDAFLDEDVRPADLAPVLARLMPMATPPVHARTMPRQSL